MEIRQIVLPNEIMNKILDILPIKDLYSYLLISPYVYYQFNYKLYRRKFHEMRKKIINKELYNCRILWQFENHFGVKHNPYECERCWKLRKIFYNIRQKEDDTSFITFITIPLLIGIMLFTLS